MTSPEWLRLTQDMQEQPALREALAQCRSREEAVTLLQGRGYNLSAEDLPEPGALSDETLDQVTGGGVRFVALY